MKYIIPSKTIEHCIHRGITIADVYTRDYHNNITFLKLVPKDESLELKHCWEAMGFYPLNREVNLSSFSSKESILDAIGLYNDSTWNEVYERIKGNSRNTVTGRWRGKPKGANQKKEWLARDKKTKQKKWSQFPSLYDLCAKYHLNYNFVERAMENLDVFCTNSGILIKKNVMAS